MIKDEKLKMLEISQMTSLQKKHVQPVLGSTFLLRLFAVPKNKKS